MDITLEEIDWSKVHQDYQQSLQFFKRIVATADTTNAYEESELAEGDLHEVVRRLKKF